MKVEHLIAQYLFLNKKVSLQEIGTFYLSDGVVMGEDDKWVMPENAVSFHFDLKAPADEGLVNFIVEKTRKIKPLATSDLESYTMLGKQFLNIGKPFVIKDLGVLLKNQLHQYEFSQGQTQPSKIESTETIIVEKEKSEAEIDFSSQKKTPEKKKLWLPVSLIVLFIVILAVVFLKFNSESDKDSQVDANEDTLVPVASVPVPKATDTLRTADTSHLQDSTIQAKPDSLFNVVIRVYNDKAIAQKWLANLSATPSGKGLILYTADSLIYKIAMPIKASLLDSAKVRDSLKLIFGKQPFVEIRK